MNTAMKIEDYLHLYIGCNAETSHGIRKLIGVEDDIAYTTGGMGFYFISEGIKPILRRLSDMTPEEAAECWKLTDTDREIEGWQVVDYFRREENFYEPKTFLYLLAKHFDLFGLIDAGLAIDKATLTDKP